jgi:hypothetical protein
MGDGSSSSFNHPTTGTAGGASFEPTPANSHISFTIQGSLRVNIEQPRTGICRGPVPAVSPVPGSFLGLEDQKARDESKYLQRADLTAHGKPTTTTSFTIQGSLRVNIEQPRTGICRGPVPAVSPVPPLTKPGYRWWCQL